MMGYALNTQSNVPAQSTPSPVASARRQGHLKRLSLNSSSLTGNESTSSPTNSMSAMTSTSISPSSARSSRSLRALSIGTDKSESTFASPGRQESPSSASHTATSPSLSRSRRSGQITSGHARRTSSISYARSPSQYHTSEPRPTDSDFKSQDSAKGNLSPSTSIRRAKVAPVAPTLGLALGFDRAPLLQSEGAEEEDDQATTPTRFESPRPCMPPNNDSDAPREATPASVTAMSCRRAEVDPPRKRLEGNSQSLTSQPTLTEANADLLSFIAKKERKCLDLREGANCRMLKIHETRNN